MINEIKIIRSEALETNLWSGGTTTELLIYPPDSIYKERNFVWRISSAKVETEISEFTSLPGVSRILMTLDGDLKIHHEGHYSKTLKPFEQDSFMGDWKTTSTGQVTDFNLMMQDDCKGTVEALSLECGKFIKNTLPKAETENRLITEVYYVVNGTLAVEADDEKYVITAGDLIHFEHLKKVNCPKCICMDQLIFKNTSDEEVKVIHVVVETVNR